MPRSCVLGLIMCLGATLAHADGTATTTRPAKVRTTRASSPRPVPFIASSLRIVPNCEEVQPRLLRCGPRRPVGRDTPSVIQIVDGPPRKQPAPYPQIFARPYGRP